MKIEKKNLENKKFQSYQLLITVEDEKDEDILSALKFESLNGIKLFLTNFNAKKEEEIINKVEYIINMIEHYIDKAKYVRRILNRK
jgi:hypothetical protein